MTPRTPKSPYESGASVTWHNDGDGYGSVSCSWEKGTRKTRVTREGAEGVAYGFGVEFRVEAAW